MGRFDKFYVLRFQTPVHVPGYDVAKSLVAAKKRHRKPSRPEAVAPGPEAAALPSGEPRQLVLGETTPKEEEPCVPPPFEL